MGNINEKRYPNINEAVAFRIAFVPMIFAYDDLSWYDTFQRNCTKCGYPEQIKDFLASKSSCKKDYGILDILHFGVNEKIHNELIENFDITEDDFRPVRNKVGNIVYYQITPRHTMLPINSVNRMRKLKPCKKCGSIQYREKMYINKQGYPYSLITQEALEDLHDINVTFEEFEMFIPEWVVSRRVYEFLVEKYPRMNFEPIFLKDSKIKRRTVKSH